MGVTQMIMEVYWIDCQTDYGEWIPVEDALEKTPAIIKTIGYLIGQDKNYLQLAMNFDTLNNHVSEVILIPIGMITKKRKLK